MSYRRSRARREFETQLDLAANELTPLYKLAHTQGSSSRLLAAYYVFAYSQLEVYVKTIVEDALDVVTTAPPKFDQVPDLLLGYLLHRTENLAGGYRRYGHDEDEGAILEKVAQIARKIESWSMGATVLTPPNASDVLDKKKYPSPKNLPQLFRRLGVKRIWAVVDKAGKFQGELILTSLNDLRTSIAHEGKIPASFSLSDFRRSLEQMRRFVGALDRGLSTHFCSGMISRKTWNGGMT